MADYRIKAQQTAPRTFKKELQMISYRGSSLFSDEGNILVSERDVYYPPDYLAEKSISVVTDTLSYQENGLSLSNKFKKGRPAALPIAERFNAESETSRSLLGIDRAEVQQGLFDDVSTYGLDRKDWIVYSAFPDNGQGPNWEFKNSPAGPHNASIDADYSEGSSIVQTSFPVPYLNPGNAPVFNRVRGISAQPGPGWGRYAQSIIAMYIIEYMVNNFTPQEREAFRLSFLERKYPKTVDGKFDRLYWDQIWSDIDQGRFEVSTNIPIIPQGRIVNMSLADGEDTLDLIALFGSELPSDNATVSVNYTDLFFATTRYTWIEPDQGHYRIATNPNFDVWSKYWKIDYNALPEELRNWEFQIYESENDVPEYVNTYKLPYFLIESKNPSSSLIFGRSWPQSFTDPAIPQITNSIADGNLIGARESQYAVITLTSVRAFRYQPGRISGFTYGVRVSEEGAGPGSVLEWGVENYTDGYFFRLENGTDFSVVRRSTVPLGSTQLFIDAKYVEREAYISQTTGVVRYIDELTASEVLIYEEEEAAGKQTRVFETVIQQNQMNGDGLDSTGPSGYIYNPDTVTMYKIEFGWYGAIGARFYVYIPQGNGDARWVAVHTLVIENQLAQPCLEDPFFFFKYRVYVDNPSRIRLPQFIEKYGASYYIDGGDEGTVSISTGKAFNRELPPIPDLSVSTDIYNWASVIGVKPKTVITNTEGNTFPNKKEIFPESISVTSTIPAEIKFVNQFGCRENAYTFQEGYRCELPESQRLRGLFSISSLRTDESNLVALGRDINSPVPTVSFIESDFNYLDSVTNLIDIETGEFIGWNAYNNSLHGAHVIGEDLYCSYINPTQEGLTTPTGFDGVEIVLQRSTFESLFSTNTRSRNWSSSELLFKYPVQVALKLSKFRKDTTLLSTVDITSDEFYLLFTNQIPQDTLGACGENGEAGCDGEHFGDFQIGVVWPLEDPGSYTYPESIVSRSRVGKNFGIIDPNDSDDRTISNSEVEVLESGGFYYVVDKEIPNSSEYRYYEGLPIDFTDNAISDNVLLVNQAGYLSIDAQGLEIAEGLFRNQILGEVDKQFPQVPGADGGECLSIYGRAGEIQQNATFTSADAEGVVIAGRFYLSSTSSWPSDLWQSSNSLFTENPDTGQSITVRTISGVAQQVFTPEGTSVRLYLLPINVISGSAFSDDTRVVAKYRAIALYSSTLTKTADRLLAQKIVGQNLFPLRFFIRMREGAKIGGLTVGQVTARGVIQKPFTPHGCTLSVSNTDGEADRHDGGSGDTNTSAIKTMIAYSEPGTLTEANYSFYDVRFSPSDKDKKCPSFISRDILSGAGFSGSGDYPVRWLKFKESGDPLATYYVPANIPTEIDLSSVFNINTESIGPSFWGNKALFLIARGLEENVLGRMNVTLNYKEQ